MVQFDMGTILLAVFDVEDVFRRVDDALATAF